MTVLSCSGLVAGYGSNAVVRRLDLAVRSGEVVALLGPNGAGKTTTLLTLAGLLPRLGGEIRLGETSTEKLSAAAVAKRGLVLVPDDRSLFTTLTVRENLVLGKRKGGIPVDDALEFFPALSRRLDVGAGQLSGGEQQMLAVARALMQQPKVLLIDELSMGLAPIIVESLLPTVRRIATDTGAGVVLVEQHVMMALRVADTAVVLVHGEVALAGAAADLLADESRLAEAYLGT